MAKTDCKIAIGLHGPNRVEITGLDPREAELIEASVRGGFYWIRVDKEKGFQHVPTYEVLPDPIRDKEMQPFWREPTPLEIKLQGQLKLLNLAEMADNCSPSITISSLCGYYYTPKNYATEAEKLESYGFACMRSRRGDDGRFYEHWLLSGLWSAKGDLREAVIAEPIMSEKDRLVKALEFLRRHVSFGTLDVSVQRLAMMCPE